MRVFLTALLLLAFVRPAPASLYAYPEEKRPMVSLRAACVLADAMLQSRGDAGRFYLVRVSLAGDKAQSGAGTWNLWHRDEAGNQVNAAVSFPKLECDLLYFPPAGSSGERERVFRFVRQGLTVKPLP